MVSDVNLGLCELRYLPGPGATDRNFWSANGSKCLRVYFAVGIRTHSILDQSLHFIKRKGYLDTSLSKIPRNKRRKARDTWFQGLTFTLYPVR